MRKMMLSTFDASSRQKFPLFLAFNLYWNRQESSNN